MSDDRPAAERPAPQALPPGDFLPDADGHRVWWCEGGAADGVPVLIVHGGPGGSSRVEPTRWFDGLPVRWIAIDQRGCGRSTPRGATAHNDLPALLRDVERLRTHLGLARWALCGGSWGARVALAVARAQPEAVRGLLLRSPFLGAAAETQRYIAAWPAWLGDGGRHWVGEAPAATVEALYRATPLLSCGAIDALMTEPIAQAWAAYDDAQSARGGVAATGARFDPLKLPQAGDALAAWRVHAHYAARAWGAQDGFAAGWPLAAGADEVSAGSGPILVVWGSADATCDPSTARALVQRLPGAVGHEVAGAGHRMNDPWLSAALRDAARAWIRGLSP